MRWFIVILLVFVLASGAAADTTTHGMPDQSRQRQQWSGDIAARFVVSGCLPTVPGGGGTTLPTFACEGYVKDSTTGELLYVSQETSTVSLSGGNGTYWVAVHKDRSTSVSSWTRQSGTHYLWRISASQVADPANGRIIASVVVAAGAITSVTDMRNGNPVIPAWLTSELPTAGLKGRLARITDGIRARHQDTGAMWAPDHPYVDPRWFGALCDNSTTTTDAAAFTLAFAAATTSKVPVVLVPAGTCLLDDEIVGKTGVSLIGFGAGQSILKQKTNGALDNLVAYETASDSVTVQGITFDGNFANQSAGAPAKRIVLLAVTSGTNWRVYDNEFKNAYGGGGVTGAPVAMGGTSVRAMFRGNRFHDNGTTTTFPADCIYYSGFALQVHQNIFENCTDTATAFESKSTDASNPADNTTIVGNSYSGNTQSIGISAAVASTYMNGVTVADNFIEGHNANSTGAIYFWPVASVPNLIENINITGNVIRGTTIGYGILVFHASNITVANNTVSLAGQLGGNQSYTGIFVGKSDHVTIVGNHSYDNGNAGINVQGSTDVLIQGNLVHGNALANATQGGIALNQYSVGPVQNARIRVIGNVSTGTSQGYGLAAADTLADLAVIGNDFRGNNSGAMSLGASVTARKYANLTNAVSADPIAEAEVQEGQILKAVTFSQLSGGTAGLVVYCSDCTTDHVCAGSGAGAIAKRYGSAWRCRERPSSYAFANLPASSNGDSVYCTDCTKATPCAGGGAGAVAWRINGAWECNP